MGFIDGNINGVSLADLSPRAVRIAFVKENGDCIVDESGMWHIFQNGAMAERNPAGAYVPAYTEIDPNIESGASRVKQTLCRKLLYLNTKLGRVIREFEDLKKELEGRANDASQHCAAPPDQDEIDKLHELKAEVKQWQEKVDAVSLQLNPPPPPVSPERLQRDAAIREQAQKVRDEIKAIEV